MLDLAALGILGIFALVGALRGTLSSALKIGSLLLAYGAGLAAAPRLGPELARAVGLPSLLGSALAGTLAFVVAYFALGVLSTLIKLSARRRRPRRSHEPRTLDRLGGAALGAAHGAIVVLLLGLLVSYAEALSHTASASHLPSVPGASHSRLVTVSRSLARRGAEAAFRDAGTGGRMAVELVANPAETMERLKNLLDNARIKTLQEDRLFWSYVEHGAIDQALNRVSFMGIAHDETLRGQLVEMGLVSEPARADPRLFRSAARDVLKRIGPRIQRLKQDPSFRELAEDPAIAQALRSGDTMALLGHPGFRRLIRLALDPQAPPEASGEDREAGDASG